MANKDLIIRIAAVDNATKIVQKVQGALNRSLGPAGKLIRSFSSIGSKGASALNKINSGLQKAASLTRSLSDRVASIVPGLGALVGILGGAGIAAIAERWGQLGFSLRTTSRQLGMSTRSLQAWHYAARRAGVTAEQFDQSMASSQDTIRSAAFGANPQAMMLLNRLGVNISRGKDGQIDYEKTQQDIMTALGKIKNPTGQRTAAAALGMGGLLSMIQNGTFNADRQSALNKGLVMSDDDIARAAAFREDVNDMQQSVEGLSNTIGSRLVPILDPLVRKFSDWLNDHRVEIANKLADATQKFTDWISRVNWGDLYDKVNRIVDKFGGLTTIIETLVGLKLAATFLSWGAGLLTLAGRLTGAANAAKALKTAAGVEAAVEGGAAIGAGTVIAGTTVAAGVLAAPLAYGASRLYHNMTDTESGIKQRIADRQARIDELSRLAVLDPRNADRYMAQRAEIQKSLDAYRIKLKVLQAGASSKAPLGIRSNNPLNLQPGGVESVYGSPEEGIAAATANLRRNYSGLTIAQIVDKWTGGARAGNTPAQTGNYTRLLERATGLSANQRPDLADPHLVSALLTAQIRAENGQQPYTDEQIMAGVQAGLSGKPIASNSAGDAANPGGNQLSAQDMIQAFDASIQKMATAVHVTVNAPQGTSVEARHSSGDYVPTRVNYAMAMGAMP